MSTDTILGPFIAHARGKGMDHATIRMLLLAAGWKEKDIAQALAGQTLDIPVPAPTDGGGAREAFFQLLTFTSLYTTLISLVVLFFTYINRLFPDVAFDGPYVQTDGDFSGIRWSIAAIIVSFPLFVWLTKYLVAEMRRHPEKVWSAVRRWLTYLTLFVTAGALICDLITLVFYLLEGEISVRFLLKVAVVLVLAGMTFTYYFFSMRLQPAEQKSTPIHRQFGMGGLAVVAIALVWGMAIVGLPGGERLRRLDERRVNDLRAIHQEIQQIVHDGRAWETPKPSRLQKALPKTLDAVLEQARYQRPSIVDPATGTPYEYIVDKATAYRLCADFATERKQSYDIFWDHPGGRHCFTFDALDPQVR